MVDFIYISYILTEVIILSGVVGNILTVIVFSRATFRKNSISVYSRALAIFDSFSLYQTIVVFYLLLYNDYILTDSDAVCKIIFYILYAFGSIPGWILIALSIDKLLSLKKANTVMKRPLLHFMIVFAIVIANLLIYIGIPIYLTRVPIPMGDSIYWLCDPIVLPFANTLGIIYIIEGSVLPFCILFVTALITIKLLRDSRRHVEAIGSVSEKRKNNERKFAVTSIAFSISFIVLKMPFVIGVAIGYSNVSSNFIQIGSLFYFLNFSIGFLLHFTSNSLFRRELLIILRIRKPNVVESVTQTNHVKNTRNFRTNS